MEVAATMSRISRLEMLIGFAMVAAKRSTCLRRQVGAVIAYDGRVLSTGYAGAPSGMEHCNPSNCTPANPCTRTVHAEANAIAFAARKGIAVEGAEMVCTLSPCYTCAQLIINAGIEKVSYTELYRINDGIVLLQQAGVDVYNAGPELQKMLSMGEQH